MVWNDVGKALNDMLPCLTNAALHPQNVEYFKCNTKMNTPCVTKNVRPASNIGHRSDASPGLHFNFNQILRGRCARLCRLVLSDSGRYNSHMKNQGIQRKKWRSNIRTDALSPISTGFLLHHRIYVCWFLKKMCVCVCVRAPYNSVDLTYNRARREYNRKKCLFNCYTGIMDYQNNINDKPGHKSQPGASGTAFSCFHKIEVLISLRMIGSYECLQPNTGVPQDSSSQRCTPTHRPGPQTHWDRQKYQKVPGTNSTTIHGNGLVPKRMYYKFEFFPEQH